MVSDNKFVNEIKVLRKSINKYSYLCTKPLTNFTLNNINSTDNYTHLHKDFKNPCHLALTRNFDKDTTYTQAYKVQVLFSNYQKRIINNWMEASRRMYNATLYYYKDRRFNDKKSTYDYKKIRTYHLNKIKQNIIDTSTIKIKNKKVKNKKIKYKHIKPLSHMLDATIKLACSNYKSALTNLRNGNIKHFRIRYWKQNKSQISIELEKTCFGKKETFCERSLGRKIDITHDYKVDLKLSKIKETCRLIHNRTENKYYLYIPKERDVNIQRNTNNYVGIDPGFRTFMTCFSKTSIDKFEIDKSKYIRIFNLIDRTENNPYIPMKKKMEVRCKRMHKISNITDAIHWKLINYIVNANRYIFIGDMSVKDIISKQNKILTRMEKRIGNAMKYYQFRQRLEYKCITKGKYYSTVNEIMTSKMCTRCTKIKRDLRGQEIYNCTRCDTQIDRDSQGALNIALKGIYKFINNID